MALSTTQQAAATLEAAILEFQAAINNDAALLDESERKLLRARIDTSKRVLDTIRARITR